MKSSLQISNSDSLGILLHELYSFACCHRCVSSVIAFVILLVVIGLKGVLSSAKLVLGILFTLQGYMTVTVHEYVSKPWYPGESKDSP